MKPEEKLITGAKVVVLKFKATRLKKLVEFPII